ncbi:TlpA disulfide reductase family protein [Flavobacterium sp. K5-23]|uniref:TlpA family protein disulfide reductase n=1 Tax=Flavobacterium sp. K5-23 TaxID=2746225 RepID=UPI00200E487D|nr:TlpA disulfide reductase family protein [Flavobacterium sp. K5-23]UQD57575.1 TlpA family protein disulfide reductase [Flavobacterium sp. K5-23]
MKNRIILITISILLITISCKKTEEKIEINVTDYISNIPTDKSFKNKFIVLEFWATWCAPCLSAVPHINELQNKFKSNNDLIFVSITDEKAEKVRNTLKHIEFSTIVISDQTKKTHKTLNVSAIPITVLIDNNGIVRWKGNPEELNEELIEKFINGKISPNIDNKKTNIEGAKSQDDKNNEDLEDVVFKIIKNKQTKYTFTLINTNGNNSMIASALVKGKYIASNKKLSEIISNLLDINEQQVIISEKFKNNKYSLIYKNSDIKSAESGIADIIYNLLKTLDLKEIIQNKNTEIYKLKIIDKNKIEISKEPKTEIGHSGSSTKIVCSNTEIKSLINEINNSFNILVKDETNLKGKYDFLIRNKSMENLKQDLEKYGLKLEKTIEIEKLYNYN